MGWRCLAHAARGAPGDVRRVARRHRRSRRSRWARALFGRRSTGPPREGERIALGKHPGAAVAFDARGNTVLQASEHVYVFDPARGEPRERRVLVGPVDALDRVALSPDLEHAAVVGRRRPLRVLAVEPAS